MKKRPVSLWLVFLIVVEAIVIALMLTRVLTPDSSSLLLMGVYWLWTGLPGKDDGRFDRYEKQVYGLAVGMMGLLWIAISFTPWADQWIPVLLTLVPPALIALVGRFWYVEKKRNEAYHKNLTEKD